MILFCELRNRDEVKQKPSKRSSTYSRLTIRARSLAATNLNTGSGLPYVRRIITSDPFWFICMHIVRWCENEIVNGCTLRCEKLFFLHHSCVVIKLIKKYIHSFIVLSAPNPKKFFMNLTFLFNNNSFIVWSNVISPFSFLVLTWYITLT